MNFLLSRRRNLGVLRFQMTWMIQRQAAVHMNIQDALLEGCTLRELWDDYGIVGDLEV
jgi:hypothetical protein